MNDTQESRDLILDESVLDNTLTCFHDEAPAMWIAGCRRCPAFVFWCESHHAGKMRAAENPRAQFYCGGCGAEGRDWHALFWKRQV